MSAVKRDYDSGPGADSKAAEASRVAADVAARLASANASGQSPIVAGAARRNDAPFVKDIEINDLRNRYLLTKDDAQAQLMKESGANIKTMGVWIPDTSIPTRDAPLYLHVTAQTQHSLDKAVTAINKIIAADLGPLTHRPGMGEQERPQRRKWPEEKVPIALEPLRNFNVRAKIVGPAGLFVKYIQQETGARVQIKGLGSGFVEHETGQEANEPMHINIVGPDEAQVARGKQLAEDLLMVVREKWHEASGTGYSSAYNQAYGAQYGFQQQAAPLPTDSAPLPPGAPPAAPDQDPAAIAKAQEEYMAQINSNPEYAAYYQKLQEYYASQGMAVPGAAGSAPLPAGSAPLPPSGAPPPPPDEPRREGRGQYGAVPPPPM